MKNVLSMLKPLRAIVYLLIVAFLCWQVWRVRHGMGDSIGAVGWRGIGLATVFTLIANFPGFFGWRLLVADAGVRLSFSDGAWIFFMSGATRYLPGAIWPTVTQAALAKKVGASTSKLMTTGLIALVLTTLSGLVVGLLAFPHLVSADPKWWLMLPVLLAAGAVMLTPRLLGRLLGLGQRILRRGEHEIVLPGRRASVGMITLSILGWCCSGMHAAIIAVSLGAPPMSALTLGVGGFTMSAVVGALSLAPVGIGVREVVLGLTLGVLISGPNLVTLLLLSRILTTFSHVSATLAVLGVLAGRRCMARRQGKEIPPEPRPEGQSLRAETLPPSVGRPDPEQKGTAV